MRAYAFQNLDGDFISPYRVGDRLLLSWVGSVEADAPDEAACDKIFAHLNRDDRPNRFVAPSLSTGDVVTLVDDGRVVSWAVQPLGFRRVEEVLPDASQAEAYHRARAEAEELARPVLRPEQERAVAAAEQRGARRTPPLALGQPLAESREVAAARNWLATVRERLVEDSDAYADVDLLYNLYVALTGEDIPFPYD